MWGTKRGAKAGVPLWGNPGFAFFLKKVLTLGKVLICFFPPKTKVNPFPKGAKKGPNPKGAKGVPTGAKGGPRGKEFGGPWGKKGGL